MTSEIISDLSVIWIIRLILFNVYNDINMSSIQKPANQSRAFFNQFYLYLKIFKLCIHSRVPLQSEEGFRVLRTSAIQNERI